MDGTWCHVYSCSHLFLHSNKNLVFTSTNLQLFRCNAWAGPNCPANAEYGYWTVKLDIVAGPRCWLRCWASFSFRKRRFVALRSSGHWPSRGSVACCQSAENFAQGLSTHLLNFLWWRLTFSSLAILQSTYMNAQPLRQSWTNQEGWCFNSNKAHSRWWGKTLCPVAGEPPMFLNLTFDYICWYSVKSFRNPRADISTFERAIT